MLVINMTENGKIAAVMEKRISHCNACDRYDGEWQNCKCNGGWILHWPNRDKHDGEWQIWNCNGRWILHCDNDDDDDIK